MSFPGVSKHRRISIVCWRTTDKASSSNLAWSSTAGGGEVDILGGVWYQIGRPNSHIYYLDVMEDCDVRRGPR